MRFHLTKGTFMIIYTLLRGAPVLPQIGHANEMTNQYSERVRVPIVLLNQAYFFIKLSFR